MPMSVDDLLAGFPLPGADYVLSSDLWDLAELYDLLGNGEELVLRVTDVVRDRLTVIGEAAIGSHNMEVVLEFLADSPAADAIVAGVTARIQGVIELVAAAAVWALDLTEAPRAFIADLAELAAHYDLTVGSVAITAQTEHLRLAFARPTAAVPLAALIGIKDTAAYLPELPYIGDELLGGEAIGVRGVQLAVIARGTVTAEQAAALNAVVAAAVAGHDDASEWPLMPDHDLEVGLWVGAAFVLPAPAVAESRTTEAAADRPDLACGIRWWRRRMGLQPCLRRGLRHRRDHDRPTGTGLRRQLQPPVDQTQVPEHRIEAARRLADAVRCPGDTERADRSYRRVGGR